MADQREAATTGAAEPTAGRKATIAALLVVGTLAVAVVGAILTSDAAGQLNIWIEQFTGSGQRGLGDLGTLLPLGFAFAAGMVSAFNPCGFPMLPTYIALFLSEDDAGGRTRTTVRLARSVTVGATVTVAFVLLFAVIGFTIAAGAGAFVNVIPWVALGLGVILVAVGGYRVAGGTLYSALPERLGAKVGPGNGGISGYFLFGLAYGLASLSCTLPIFLAVLGTTLTGTSLASSLGAVLLYGLGMGTVIMTLTVTAGLFKSAVAARMRGLVRYVDKIGTGALFVAGAYVVYYWLTIGGLIF
jgi:cytochrome c-type biogenesis protein